MTYIANRQITSGGVPKNMSMLLVRQEIMGNELSAVETVLRSDVKREAVKRCISSCGSELERLEKGETESTIVGIDKEPKADVSKGKQKLRDRKKVRMQSVARAKTSREPSGASADRPIATNDED